MQHAGELVCVAKNTIDQTSKHFVLIVLNSQTTTTTTVKATDTSAHEHQLSN
jgi:hypothetical protein